MANQPEAGAEQGQPLHRQGGQKSGGRRMIGPELQKAIYDALKTVPAVAGGRVYDSVPSNAEFPYVTIGGEQTVDDGNSCEDGWEVFTDVHVWSRKPGFPECKEI